MNSFYTRLARISNTGQSRSVVLCGNIYDMFFDGEKYVPLVDYLSKMAKVEKNSQNRGITQVIYEINKPIRIIGNAEELLGVWNQLKPGEDFEVLRKEAWNNSIVALELLRQLTIASRKFKMSNNLMVIIEGAELILPEVELSRMQFADRKRTAIVHDWFSDPDFVSGHDTVILLAESRSQIHSLVSKLPQVLSVEVPFPDLEHRRHFIEMMGGNKYRELAKQTAGLSIHAIRQLLCEQDVSREAVIAKVEEFICNQLGDDVVEFKRPTHKLDDLIGFTQIKEFCRNELIPSMWANEDSLSGAAVAGAIGGGKSYIMEAVATEVDVPVLVLKNLRSQYYGQTDVIFERVRRVLIALDRLMVFVDEADTQFGGVGADTHETERRLTGKIQSMMSDPALVGKVFWLLMTARIEQLSPDIRRPGRAGDLIIPILDPEGEDRDDFVRWIVKGIVDFQQPQNITVTEAIKKLDVLTKGYSAASFSALRKQVKRKNCQTIDEVLAVAEDIIPSDIEDARRYQTLQALSNCTRKSLLPKGVADLTLMRTSWQKELAELEMKRRR